MAKNTTGGTRKRINGEAAAQPARERRRTAKASATASAPDVAASETSARPEAAAPLHAAGARRRPGKGAPSNEEIARLAYELYLQRGGVNGYHLEDWYEAERKLRGRA